MDGLAHASQSQRLPARNKAIFGVYYQWLVIIVHRFVIGMGYVLIVPRLYYTLIFPIADPKARYFEGGASVFSDFSLCIFRCAVWTDSLGEYSSCNGKISLKTGFDNTVFSQLWSEKVRARPVQFTVLTFIFCWARRWVFYWAVPIKLKQQYSNCPGLVFSPSIRSSVVLAVYSSDLY